MVIFKFKTRSNMTNCAFVKMPVSSSEKQVHTSVWVFKKFKNSMSSEDLSETY